MPSSTSALYSSRVGCLPPSDLGSSVAASLIALCKDGDRPEATDASDRKLRPIAIGSTIARAISMVAAAQYRARFAAYLQPPPPGSQQTAQPDGAPWPAQVGVACCSGLEFTTHSIRAVLDEHPARGAHKGEEVQAGAPR